MFNINLLNNIKFTDITKWYWGNNLQVYKFFMSKGRTGIVPPEVTTGSRWSENTTQRGYEREIMEPHWGGFLNSHWFFHLKGGLVVAPLISSPLVLSRIRLTTLCRWTLTVHWLQLKPFHSGAASYISITHLLWRFRHEGGRFIQAPLSSFSQCEKHRLPPTPPESHRPLPCLSCKMTYRQ